MPKTPLQSDEDRALAAIQRRREQSDAVPRDGFAESSEDYTGQHANGLITKDDLERGRRSRSHSDRIGKLEDRVDKAVDQIGDLRGDVGLVKGTVEKVDERTATILTELRGQTKEKQIKLEAQSAVEVAQAKATIEDKLDAKKQRRSWLTKVVTSLIGAVLSGGVLGYIVHWLQTR